MEYSNPGPNVKAVELELPAINSNKRTVTVFFFLTSNTRWLTVFSLIHLVTTLDDIVGKYNYN